MEYEELGDFMNGCKKIYKAITTIDMQTFPPDFET